MLCNKGHGEQNKGEYFMELVHLVKSKTLWALALFAALSSHQASADQAKQLTQLRPDARLLVEIHHHSRHQNDAREIHLDLMVKATGQHYAKYKKVAKVKSLGTLILSGALPEIVAIEASEVLTALNEINWPGQHALYLQARTNNSAGQALDGSIPELTGTDSAFVSLQGEDINISLVAKLECRQSCYNDRDASVHFQSQSKSMRQLRK